LDLTGQEIAYFSANRVPFGGFDLNLITPNAVNMTQVVGMWRRVNAYATLRSSLPQSQTSLLDVFRAATAPTAALSDVEKGLVSLTGWDQTALDNLVTGLQLTAAYFVNDVAIARVQVCMRAVTTLGIAPAKLIQWASAALQGNFGDDDAQDIKRAIK